jgi:hypothetical protein
MMQTRPVTLEAFSTLVRGRTEGFSNKQNVIWAQVGVDSTVILLITLLKENMF